MCKIKLYLLLDLLWKHLLGQWVSWLGRECWAWVCFLTPVQKLWPGTEDCSHPNPWSKRQAAQGSSLRSPHLGCHSLQSKPKHQHGGLYSFFFFFTFIKFPRNITHQYVYPAFVQDPSYCCLSLASQWPLISARPKETCVSSSALNWQTSWVNLLKSG